MIDYQTFCQLRQLYDESRAGLICHGRFGPSPGWQ